ncbi:DUF6731 family protein [Geomonas edaphica]|uniref:DUF6731 family protein n=1 Tax=Geomonas edaphica TaxID=2570226 RepID=UPI0010A796DE|nr:DUF6731 family protein [Geomonas edaphica]
MPPQVRKFFFDFYQLETAAGNAGLAPMAPLHVLEEFKRKFDTPGENTVRTLNGKTLELRNIERTEYGFRGIIGKYRRSQLPHAAVPGGDERELELNADEHLVEKSYFKFFSDYSLLVLQRNHFAVGPVYLGMYLSINGYTTILNPVIEPADLQMLMRNTTQVRNIKMTIARPVNPELFQNIEHDFTNSIIASLNSSNSASINISLRGDGHSLDPTKRYLERSLKNAILEIKRNFDLKKANIGLEENGVVHPVDLVTDRLATTKDIQMVGRYPSAVDMWDGLREARQVKEVELVAYFGALNGPRLR